MIKKLNLKNKSKMEDPIIEAVIAQIKEDFLMNDESALYELLDSIPRKNLLAYLPEEISQKFDN
jgi:hypothetical protein